MAKITHCPYCYEKLVIRNVSPCCICGAWSDPPELLGAGKKYYIFSVSDKKFILCPACYLEEVLIPDTGCQPYLPKLAPEFLNLPDDNLLQDTLFYEGELDTRPEISTDKYCPECNMRLSFIRLCEYIRKINKLQNP